VPNGPGGDVRKHARKRTMRKTVACGADIHVGVAPRAAQSCRLFRAVPGRPDRPCGESRASPGRLGTFL
jgi:hypothetical protein